MLPEECVTYGNREYYKIAVVVWDRSA